MYMSNVHSKCKTYAWFFKAKNGFELDMLKPGIAKLMDYKQREVK